MFQVFKERKIVLLNPLNYCVSYVNSSTLIVTPFYDTDFATNHRYHYICCEPDLDLLLEHPK